MATKKEHDKTDHLKVDPPVVITCTKPQFKQVWSVISFISPEDRIKQRFLFEANRFLFHDVNKQIMDTTANVVKNTNVEFAKLLDKKINSYKSSTSEAYKAAAEILQSCKQEFNLDEDDSVNKVLRTYRIDQQELTDRFEVYKVQNNKELEHNFEKEYTEETSVRGVKVRGVYEEVKDARKQAEKMRNEVESAIHTYVMPVGYWCPFDPNADGVQDQEHMLPELNDLVGKYNRNVEQRNEFFQKRKQMMMDSAGSKNDPLKGELQKRLAAKKNQRLPADVREMKQLTDNDLEKVNKKKPGVSTITAPPSGKNRAERRKTKQALPEPSSSASTSEATSTDTSSEQKIVSYTMQQNEASSKSNDIVVKQNATEKSLTFEIAK